MQHRAVGTGGRTEHRSQQQAGRSGIKLGKPTINAEKLLTPVTLGIHPDGLRSPIGVFYAYAGLPYNTSVQPGRDLDRAEEARRHLAGGAGCTAAQHERGGWCAHIQGRQYAAAAVPQRPAGLCEFPERRSLQDSANHLRRSSLVHQDCDILALCHKLLLCIPALPWRAGACRRLLLLRKQPRAGRGGRQQAGSAGRQPGAGSAQAAHRQAAGAGVQAHSRAGTQAHRHREGAGAGSTYTAGGSTGGRHTQRHEEQIVRSLAL